MYVNQIGVVEWW